VDRAEVTIAMELRGPPARARRGHSQISRTAAVDGQSRLPGHRTGTVPSPDKHQCRRDCCWSISAPASRLRRIA